MTSTKKKTGAPGEAETAVETATATPPAKPRNLAAYDAALEKFTAATDHFTKGRFADALPLFEAVANAAAADEPILYDRARTYATICRGKVEAPDAGDGDADTLYHRGVVAANAGRLDEAWTLLDRAAGQRAD